jgi:hypothetical protein
MDVVGNKPVEVLAALALRLAIVFFGCIMPFPCMVEIIC